MAEPYGDRDRDPNAPQNPPNSVANRDVRRAAVRTYLLPIVLFFVLVGALLAYWSTARPATERDAAQSGDARPAGTTGRDTDRGAEGERGRAEDTPGGHNPDPRPSSPEQEAEFRGGRTITELGGVIDVNARGTIGRPVDIRDVDVERVESPTLFWIKDGNARVAVVTAAGSPPVQAGQSVNVVGTVERAGDSVRIRASRVEGSK